MTTKTILALDPGGTTGWALCRYDFEPSAQIVQARDVQWLCGQLGPQAHHSELWSLLGMQHTQEYRLVSESFEYRNKSRAGLVLDSVEYIGITRLYSELRDVVLTMQTAAKGKGFVKDQNIKDLGLWSGGWKHAMDAYRHLLYYMVHGDNSPVGLSMRNALLAKAW